MPSIVLLLPTITTAIVLLLPTIITAPVTTLFQSQRQAPAESLSPHPAQGAGAGPGGQDSPRQHHGQQRQILLKTPPNSGESLLPERSNYVGPCESTLYSSLF